MQIAQLEDNIKKAKRDLKEGIWRCYNNVALLGKNNEVRLIDLGNVHSSAAASIIQFLINELMRVDEIQTGSYEAQYRLTLPTGEIRWIASHGRVEFDGAGKPIVVRGLSLDITARKQAEEEVQLLRQEIAHVGRVTLMGQLASALAHEINQPLGAILRNAEAAELFLRNPSVDLDEIRAILADIRRDAKAFHYDWGRAK